MKKFVLFSTIFVIILVFIIPAILSFGIKYIPGGTQPSLGNTKKIYGEIVLSQSFISGKDNLSGIGVSIKNPNFANKKEARVNIYDDEEKLIRTVALNGQNIADGKFVKIIFEPIPSSKDKKFSWVISSPESVFEDALEIFLTDNPPLWSLDLKVSGQMEDGGLSYVTLHKVVNSTEVLGIIISGWISNLVKDTTFFVTYTLLILSLFLTLIYLKLK